MIYKNWKIEYDDYGYYTAVNLKDCDASQITDKSIEGIKTEIDEL